MVRAASRLPRRLSLISVALTLTLLRCSAFPLPWPLRTAVAPVEASSRSSVASARSSPSASETAGRVYDYNGYHTAVVQQGHLDAEALWTELQSRARLSACWKQMLADLKVKCRTVRGNNDLRSRLALGMAACDAEADGRMNSVFQCAASHKVQRCVQSLSEVAYSQFVQYRLHADSVCTYLEAELFQERTEVSMASLRAESEATVQVLGGLQAASEQVRAALAQSVVLQEQQTLAAHAVQAQLRVVEEGQVTALKALHISAEALVASSAQTEASLVALREGMAQATQGATQAIESLATQTRGHFHALEGHTTGLLKILTRLEDVQRVLVDQMFASHDGARALLGALLVLVLTSFSRTAVARWPALMLVVASVVTPALMGYGSRVRLLPHTTPVAMSGLGVLAALGLIVAVYAHAAASDGRHHDQLNEAIQRGVDQTVQRVAEILQQTSLSSPSGIQLPSRPSASFAAPTGAQAHLIALTPQGSGVPDADRARVGIANDVPTWRESLTRAVDGADDDDDIRALSATRTHAIEDRLVNGASPVYTSVEAWCGEHGDLPATVPATPLDIARTAASLSLSRHTAQTVEETAKDEEAAAEPTTTTHKRGRSRTKSINTPVVSSVKKRRCVTPAAKSSPKKK